MGATAAPRLATALCTLCKKPVIYVTLMTAAVVSNGSTHQRGISPDTTKKCPHVLFIKKTVMAFVLDVSNFRKNVE